MKKKYNFMNVLRVLSMFTIVFYHMLITLYIYGIRQLDSISFLFENKNMHIAKIGVCLFFMLSGAGLILSSKDDNFNIKKFYLKRFKKILIPFYIVYAFYFLFLLITRQISLTNTFAGKEIKPYSFIFTLLGMDAYLENFGVATCSLGIGEWFLGCLIFIYLLYPLLRKAMLRNKYMTMAVATIYYIAINILYSSIPILSRPPMYMNMLIKIYDFILGMFLILIIDELPKLSLYISIIVNLFFVLCPVALPGVDSFQIPIQCVTIFIIFAHLEKIFEKADGFMKIINLLSAFSYEYFLIHHCVILHMSKLGQNTTFSNIHILALFAGEVLLTSILAYLLKCIISDKYRPGFLKSISKKSY